MDAPAELAQLCKRYLFNERLLAATTQGFSPEDWALPPGPHGGNCAHWLLAHVVATRRSLLRILGDESAVEDWEAAYAQGGVSTLHAATPAPSALHAEFARQGLLLAQRLGSLSVDQAAAAFPRPLPDGGVRNCRFGRIELGRYARSFRRRRDGQIIVVFWQVHHVIFS